MADSKQDIAALRQAVQAQRQRLVEEKIEKGEVVSVPPRSLIVRDPARAQDAIEEYKSGEEAKLRAAGETRSIHFGPIDVITTGVPRDGPYWVPMLRPEERVSFKDEPALPRVLTDEDRYAYVRPVENLPPPRSQPTPEPATDEARHSIRCTVRLPDPEKDDPGQIIEGSYSLSDGVLRIFDDTGRLLGTDTLQPGDDAVHAARKILKEKRGKHLGFYDRINYRGHVV
ncbi:MAG: hypothetical protein C5B58_13655 [Acidobacteria bacterium]|nr:MAG: hypothetical protein C5B58_13655 [Acidobacteriota bacterium]